jgi:calcium-translocating P-type ATPase
MGGSQGLMEKLNTSLKTGIDSSLHRRRREATSSEPTRLVEPHYKTLNEIFLASFEDFTLKILLAASVVSLVIGIATHGIETGWIEAVAIMVAVLIVVTITTVNNYEQDQQFRKLFRTGEVKMIKAIRDGKYVDIDIQDLLVGDIFEVSTGLIMPCDSLLIEKNGKQPLISADFLVDESQMTGESKLMKKSPDTHHKEGSDCFLISGSKINDGNGMALVLSVGINSFLGITRAGMNTDIEPTPLQLKLDDLANTIGYVGTFGAGLTVVGCSIGHIISCISSEQSIFSLDSISVFMSFIVLGITIIVMAVPEGLPMAVTISLSFSVNKMAKLNSLVRDMSAVETMGGITDVCSDKTGTLTENSMTVREVYYGGQSASVQGGINEQMKKDPVLIEMCEIGCINSTVTPDLSKPFKEQTGNKTDLAIVEFANRMGIAYTSYRPSPKLVKVIPFSSERKRMSCVYDKNGVKYLYIKGAPEVLVTAFALSPWKMASSRG